MNEARFPPITNEGPLSGSPPSEGGPGGSRLVQIGKIGRLFVRFGPLLKPHRRRLALSALCMLAFIVTDLVGPWPIQGVIDGVLLGRHNRGFMLWFGGLLPSDRTRLLAVCCLA